METTSHTEMKKEELELLDGAMLKIISLLNMKTSLYWEDRR
jgi:hypothetical protein